MKKKLTNENYFSDWAEKNYCGSSQLKRFVACEAHAMAVLDGKWEDEKTTSLLIGSYVDSWMSDELVEFCQSHPELYKKDGTLKAEFIKAEEIIEKIGNDEMFMKYISGDNQTIMTGDIEGLKFKIKIDSWHKDKNVCVDLKVLKDFMPIWNEELHEKQNVIDYWKYTWQAAIYCEIIRQNTGVMPKFFNALVTKEKEPDLAITNIPEDVILENLEIVKSYIPRIIELKNKKAEPIRCEKCDYCKATKKINKIIDYRNLGMI